MFNRLWQRLATRKQAKQREQLQADLLMACQWLLRHHATAHNYSDDPDWFSKTPAKDSISGHSDIWIRLYHCDDFLLLTIHEAIIVCLWRNEAYQPVFNATEATCYRFNEGAWCDIVMRHYFEAKHAHDSKQRRKQIALFTPLDQLEED